jgi:hypothetical protein
VLIEKASVNEEDRKKISSIKTINSTTLSPEVKNIEFKFTDSGKQCFIKSNVLYVCKDRVAEVVAIVPEEQPMATKLLINDSGKFFFSLKFL